METSIITSSVLVRVIFRHRGHPLLHSQMMLWSLARLASPKKKSCQSDLLVHSSCPAGITPRLNGSSLYNMHGSCYCWCCPSRQNLCGSVGQGEDFLKTLKIVNGPLPWLPAMHELVEATLTSR
uniref:Uncharacterized protein n=1 Tax=Pyxicephalus adspersus TaxID=30357 RepID=A0AAV3AN52_PYXAD|nr:TPA: hypothetical protein GDO54_010697 [Pyxicephalus adspersus]